jgi:hypothetical protein
VGALLALLITLVLEVPLVAAAFPGQRLKLAVVALAANTFTNLLLNLVLPHLLHGNHLLPGEVFAVVFEAGAYFVASRPRDAPRSLLVSSVANTLSFSAGLIPFVSRALEG